VFIQLREQLGWINRGAHHGPRIHDLRHTFVVRRILLWQAQGMDVDRQMLALSLRPGFYNGYLSQPGWQSLAVVAVGW